MFMIITDISNYNHFHSKLFSKWKYGVTYVICTSICLFVRMSLSPLSLSLYLSLSLSRCISLSLYLSLPPRISLAVSLSHCISLPPLSLVALSRCISLSRSHCISLSLYLSPSPALSLYLSLPPFSLVLCLSLPSLSFSVSLSVSPSSHLNTRSLVLLQYMHWALAILSLRCHLPEWHTSPLQQKDWEMVTKYHLFHIDTCFRSIEFPIFFIEIPT